VFDGDRYWNQDILVHEFAHGIHLISLMTADRTFDNRLVSSYRTAMSQGKWQNTYDATDEKEYWAIGVQAYFNVGAKGPEHGDGIHNHIDNRNDLYYYDLNLYALINEAFPCLNNIIDRCGSQNDVLGDLKMNCGGGNPDYDWLVSDFIPRISAYAMNVSLKFGVKGLFLMLIQNIKSDFANSEIILFLVIKSETDHCFDENEHCEYWANTGECEINPGYMFQYCKKSCGVC
jgi:hypothetical protein